MSVCRFTLRATKIFFKYVIQTTLMLNSYVQYAVNDPS